MINMLQKNGVDWSSIDTVLLDMDGTLLDLHYDNQFWLHHLPKRYAEKEGLSVEVARHSLLSRYATRLGQLEWYCVDFWSQETGLDVAALKEEIADLIAIQPYVIPFLQALQIRQKRIILVTNAHPKSLSLKMQRTQLACYFNQMVTAHDLGIPKEQETFWAKLQIVEPFNPQNTLLIEDSLPILYSAQQYGIAHLLAVQQPDRQQPPRMITEFKTIACFSEILP